MKSSTVRAALLCLVPLVFASAGAQTLGQTSGPWVLERSGTTAGLRGIHVAGPGVAWASGTNGTVLRTEDGGYEWQTCAIPPGAEKLDFRGIWAWDANTAIVMSSGPGDQSRLYKTTDGCAHWKLTDTNDDKEGFWDAMAFSSRSDGVIIGDPVKDRWAEFHTENGGNTWTRDESADGKKKGDPQPLFAASNSSLQFGTAHVGGAPDRWVGTGGDGGAAVYLGTIPCSMGMFLENRAKCRASWVWSRFSVPMASGQSAGVFSLGLRFVEGGPSGSASVFLVAVGGDYSKPDQSIGTSAYGLYNDQSNASMHWTAAAKPPHGFRSAVAWDADAQAWITVGTNGSDISYDDGKTWLPLDNGNWNALSLPWVVGTGGRIAKLDPRRLPK